MGKAKKKKAIGQHFFTIESGKASSTSMYGTLGHILRREGVDVEEFCAQFNARTAFSTGFKHFIVMIYDDRSFDFDLRKDFRERFLNHHNIPSGRRPQPVFVKAAGTAKPVVGEGFIDRSISSWRAINQSQGTNFL